MLVFDKYVQNIEIFFFNVIKIEKLNNFLTI